MATDIEKMEILDFLHETMLPDLLPGLLMTSSDQIVGIQCPSGCITLVRSTEAQKRSKVLRCIENGEPVSVCEVHSAPIFLSPV